MAPEKIEESGSSGITGIVTAVGIVCGLVGAIVGAFATRQAQQQSHSGRTYNKGGECPVCLSDMDELRVLPCGHQYHHKCIEDMKKHTKELKCPVCRKTFRN